MIIANLSHLETATADVFGAGDSFAIVKPVAIGAASSGGGRNNIASPALGLGLNLTPVTQIPIL